MYVETYFCFEADTPVLPPEKPKPQPSVNFELKMFSTYYSLFKIKSIVVTQENKQQDFIDEEIEAEIKGFFATENLNTEKFAPLIINSEFYHTIIINSIRKNVRVVLS